MNQRQKPIKNIPVGRVSHLINRLGAVSVYENSVHENRDALFFMIRRQLDKYLMVVVDGPEADIGDFTGDPINAGGQEGLLCELSHENATVLRKRFDFTNPVLLGKKDSYGLGDRLGNAGPAHLRAVRGTGFKPVLAQQSIRELERTGRTADEVMDAATWAVFQEGYHAGFGADGDHLKTTDDIDKMVAAGYTMFTIDPSEYVVDHSSGLEADSLEERYQKLPWNELEDDPGVLLNRYAGKHIALNAEKILPDQRMIMEGMVKYGRVLTHTNKMTRYLSDKYPDHPAEIELSVDETEKPTTPFEHYLIASELGRLGVELVSLAPRFCGDFEKGVDFRGDLDQFRDEYLHHLAIAGKFGGYKLSIHSGSDKFSVYEVIGALDGGAVHVKTAGTSYLEAVRTVAQVDPGFFREILSFSMSRFEQDRKTYHISAQLSRVPDTTGMSAEELVSLMDEDDVRQILHVAYGSVLSGDQPEASGFKSRLMELLESNEGLHEQNLQRHFEKHLKPFQRT